MDTPHTKKRAAQYRGPSTSDDYNKRIEENYQDIVLLFNRARISEIELDELYRRMAKEYFSMARAVGDLESRISTLEGASNRLSFFSENQIDNTRFDGTGFDIAVEERLYSDTAHGLLILPKIDASSISKLRFTDADGNEVIPTGLETRVSGDLNSADTPAAIIDSSDPEFALYRKPGLIWERNVVVDSPDVDGAVMTLYLKVPTDLFTTEKSNVVVLHPFPYFGTTVEDIKYTTRVDPLLQSSDGYNDFNPSGYYTGENDAVGWVVPGGWSGGDAGTDEIVNSGPKAFYFEPKAITAIQIRLRQDNYYREGSKYIYSYGLSQLDLRYDKLLSQGRTILKFEAPSGTISSIDTVTPEIWNVSPAVINNVFSYRVIWETAPDSGVYTETPVANSEKVWIEITLDNDESWVPALSGLIVDYS